MTNHLVAALFLALNISTAVTAEDSKMNEPKEGAPASEVEIATFGAGCFWCTEAVFEKLAGVKSVVSGYLGGDKGKPTYREVCSGKTGHAEAVQIAYDPRKISYEHLLSIFWKAHDPTTLNRQGADVGTQYRSAIFYHSDAQKKAAEAAKKELNDSGKYGKPIVTEVSAATTFYEAEGYHQDYFRRNSGAPYCRAVIVPKLKKLELEKAFGE